MLFVLLGCIAFGFLYIFDFNKLHRAIPFGGVLFFVGCTMIFVSSVAVFFSGYIRFMLPLPLRLICGALSLFSLIMMLWALFFSLPFSRTYVEGTGDGVVNTGLYAMCRHPGVIFFSLMYICLWLVSGSDTMLLAAICWTAMDVLHVYVQDKWFFPKTLSGYENYRLEVPFLIPCAASVRMGIETLGGKERKQK